MMSAHQTSGQSQNEPKKKWAMIADLSRCVGCQTCTSACKHSNDTTPGVQWRKVLDFEVGEFPEVSRAFVPVGCMHCEDPPCLDVCPSTATRKRADGIVTIDYDICIGCSYCAVACPYQARWRVDKPKAAFCGKAMRHEVTNDAPERRGVAQKCTFCVDRIDYGLENGLVPGLDHQATPACVNSCIADALHFGDINDPASNVSTLLEENKSFVMHEDIGTGPNFHYLWDRGPDDGSAKKRPEMVAEPVGLDDLSPQLQTSWDWRAAANFICGGTGTGLFALSALATTFVAPEIISPFSPPAYLALTGIGLLSLALVGFGLFCVWLEIGRPLRFLNVFRHVRLSWMTREAMVGVALMGTALVAIITSSSVIWSIAGLIGLAFLYCQGRILMAAKGIAAWRQKEIVELIIATGLTEGLGAFGAIGALLVMSESGIKLPLLEVAGIGLSAMLVLRYLAWHRYRTALGKAGAPTKTFAALDSGIFNLTLKSQIGVLIVALGAIALPALLIPAGILALLSGWVFKATLITRAAYNQGFALNRLPVRGSGKSAEGIQPGWTRS